MGTEGASVTFFVTDCLQNLKTFEKGFLKTQTFFFPFFRRGKNRYAYWLHLERSVASISKNLTNKKQKNLLYMLEPFWKQARHGF